MNHIDKIENNKIILAAFKLITTDDNFYEGLDELILTDYINDLLDQIKTDNVLTYETLRSWNEYEITNIKYDKEVFNNYHSYIVEFEIKNQNALLPTKKNKEKSTSN